MKLLRLALVLVALVAVYFFYIRDKYLQYPIETTLTNVEGSVIEAQIIGRDNQSVQLKIGDDQQIYDYTISELSWFSQVKIHLLPNHRAHIAPDSTVTISEMHLEGMESQLLEHKSQMKLLIVKLQSQPSPNEKIHVQRQIDELDMKIKKLNYQIKAFQEHN